MAFPRRPRARRAAPRRARVAAPATAKPKRAVRSRPLRRARVAPTAITRIRGGGVTSASTFMPTSVRTSPSVVRGIKMIGSPNIYMNQNSFNLSTAPGLQAAWSAAHMAVPLLQVVRNDITDITASPAGGLPIRYVVESYQSLLTMTNSSNTPIEVDIYDLTLKRDLSQTGTYTTSLGTYQLTPAPDALWSTGVRLGAGQQPFPNPTEVSQVIGSSPFDSQLFRDFFHVKKRTMVSLPQGAVHRHQVLAKPSYLVQDSFLQNSVANGILGLTGFTMFVVRGYPSTGTEQQEPPVPFTTTTPASLSIVQTIRVKYSWSQDFSNSIYWKNNLPAFQPPILNIGSGAVDAYDACA